MNSILLIICILTQLIFTGELFASTKRRVVIGELISESLHSDERVKLSRKGIVETIDVGANEIQFLAVGTGLLVITIEDDFGVPKRKLIFEVVKKEERSNLGSFLVRKDIYDFICLRTVKVRCDEQRYQVNGIADDDSWFYQAMQYCMKFRPCIFNVMMSDKARISIKEKIKSQRRIYGVDIKENGSIYLKIDCSFWTKKRLDKLLKANHIPAQNLDSECSYSPEQFLVKIIASTNRTSESNQLKPWILSDFNRFAGRQLLEINAEKNIIHSKILSEPEFWMSPYKKVAINHGLEIPVQSNSDNAEQYWRRLGFQVEMSILDMDVDRIYISYEVRLSEPGQYGSKVYSAGMKSEAWVRLNQKEKLGFLITQSKNNGKNSHFFLSMIPIIGPIFTNSSHDEGMARIRVDILAMSQK